MQIGERVSSTASLATMNCLLPGTSTIVEFELYIGAIDSQKFRDVREILAAVHDTILHGVTLIVAQVAARTYLDLKAANQPD